MLEGKSFLTEPMWLLTIFTSVSNSVQDRRQLRLDVVTPHQVLPRVHCSHSRPGSPILFLSYTRYPAATHPIYSSSWLENSCFKTNKQKTNNKKAQGKKALRYLIQAARPSPPTGGMPGGGMGGGTGGCPPGGTAGGG